MSAATQRAEETRAEAEAEIDHLRDQIDRAQQDRVPAASSDGPVAPRAAGSEEIDGLLPTAAGRRMFSAADRRSFERLSAGLPGNEGIAVSAMGFGQPVAVLGGLRRGVAWSTAKVPVAMAAVAADLGSAEDLRLAITASDNAAAERLWQALGPTTQAAAAATAQLRATGDQRTIVPARRLRPGYTAFGQADWRLSDQVRVVAGMRCTSAGQGVLELMGEVVPEQRWGLGAVGRSAALKGGWGPGRTPGAPDGWIDRQMGTLTLGRHELAVALITDARDHDTGMRHLTALARWVSTHVNARAIGPASC